MRRESWRRWRGFSTGKDASLATSSDPGVTATDVLGAGCTFAGYVVQAGHPWGYSLNPWGLGCVP